MDHNYARPDHLQSVVTVWTSNGEDPNHFHPDYFGKGYRWHDPMVWRMEVAYRKAREVFEANGRVVKNATVGGCYVRHHLSLNRRLQPAVRQGQFLHSSQTSADRKSVGRERVCQYG